MYMFKKFNADGVISNSSLELLLQVVYSNCSARCESNKVNNCELCYCTSIDGLFQQKQVYSTILFLSQLEANTIFY